jgi:hypothetical protein
MFLCRLLPLLILAPQFRSLTLFPWL